MFNFALFKRGGDSSGSLGDTHAVIEKKHPISTMELSEGVLVIKMNASMPGSMKQVRGALYTHQCTLHRKRARTHPNNPHYQKLKLGEHPKDYTYEVNADKHQIIVSKTISEAFKCLVNSNLIAADQSWPAEIQTLVDEVQTSLQQQQPTVANTMAISC